MASFAQTVLAANRDIFARMAEYEVEVKRVINAGGIGQRSDVLNQVFANVLGRPDVSLASSAVGLGSANFAFLAAGVFSSIEDAQAQICPHLKPSLTALREEISTT